MLCINTHSAPKGLIFWLHGLGADCNDFSFFFKNDLFKNYEIILPNAPLRNISINNGLKMRGWFDLKSLSFNDLNFDEIKESADNIAMLLRQSKKPIHRKVIIGGFSQGAAIALYSAVNSIPDIDGVVSFSGFYPQTSNKTSNVNCPILIAHGYDDEIINYDFAIDSYKYISSPKATIKSYNIGHSVCDQQALDLFNFLESI
ncbi:MAG: dienelactone hydrolase family protein [Nitrosomonadales bacterium]|jgi:phospholipase/carboxylesterase